MEKELQQNEFIVTKTDIKGNITYANKPFLNIVNANEKDLLGKPHNVVRHPDMPKAIFRYLWQTLKNKEEVFAFVKNKTNDNGYYWVFANISVSYDINGSIIGYYSVRRKINPKAKDFINKLYKKMLEVEKTNGVDMSWQVLIDTLKEVNKTYNEFVLNLQGDN